MLSSMTTDDVLGKIALDPQGDILGTVVKVHLHPELKELQGITIDQGLFRPDLFVGIAFIKKFGIDAVLLTHRHYHAIKGKKVFSAQGKLLGTVSNVETAQGELIKITITKKKGMFKKEENTIPAKDIKEIGEVITLRRHSFPSNPFKKKEKNKENPQENETPITKEQHQT